MKPIDPSKTPWIRPVARAVVLPLPSLALSLGSSQAATTAYTWTGLSSSGSNYSDSANWTSSTAGAPTSDTNTIIVLNANSGASQTSINLDSATTARYINFTGITSNYTIGGSDLTLGYAGTVLYANDKAFTQTVTFNTNINLTGTGGMVIQSGTITNGTVSAGGFIFNGNITVSGTSLGWKGYTTGNQINGIVGGTNGTYILLNLSTCGATGGVTLSNSNNRLSSVYISSATVILAANNALGTGTDGNGPAISMTRQFAGTLDLNGYDQVVSSGIVGTSTTFNSFNEIITNNKAGTNSTLTYRTSSTSLDTFSVALYQTASSGTVSFVKEGSNTLLLNTDNTYKGTSGHVTNTYKGATTVKNGALIAVSTHAAGYGAVTVEATGTFGGMNTIENSSVTVNGTLIAGCGLDVILSGSGSVSDTLTLSGTTNLTMNIGSTLEIVVDENGLHSTLAKSTSASGGVWTFANGQEVTLDMLTDGASLAGTYDNIITGISSSLDVSSWVLTNAGYMGTFTNDGSNIDLVVTVVPEPSSVALVGCAGAALLVLQRRRKQAHLH